MVNDIGFNFSFTEMQAAIGIAQMKKFKAINDDFIFLVSLKDNYGDHGIVALVCLEQLSEKSIFIDTFLVSCRVLGRHLESWILSEILKRMLKYELRYLIAEFIETEKNAVAKNFLNNYGFSQFTFAHGGRSRKQCPSCGRN